MLKGLLTNRFKRERVGRHADPTADSAEAQRAGERPARGEHSGSQQHPGGRCQMQVVQGQKSLLGNVLNDKSDKTNDKKNMENLA